MLLDQFRVESDNVSYDADCIRSRYEYNDTDAELSDAGEWTVRPVKTAYEFSTDRRLPKLGVMLVGWGGNNGSTITAGILANKHGITWMTKEGLKRANYWGSLTQSATLRVGNYRGEELYAPFNSLVPMVHPNDLVLGGWDISGLNLSEAMERAQVLDFGLQQQLVPYMREHGTASRNLRRRLHRSQPGCTS
eukprot:jgi/Botrbrau1/16337/Bobra.0345s0001.1